MKSTRSECLLKSLPLCRKLRSLGQALNSSFEVIKLYLVSGSLGDCWRGVNNLQLYLTIAPVRGVRIPHVLL